MKFLRTLLFLLLFIPLSVQAIGISVTPSSIDLLSPDILDKSIVVKNISKEPIIVYIYVDDFNDKISINPNEFELLPDQVSPVNITGNFGSSSPGVQKTNISVLSKALDKRSFNAMSGIKLPLNIYISESYFTWSGPAVFVVVFLGLLIIIVLFNFLLNIFSKKTKKKKWLDINFLLYHKKKWYKWW